MGSSASQEIKRDSISIKSFTTPLVMNTILKYMLQELGIRDFQALSNPTTCNKYVLFMANNIYKHFSDIQLFPYRNEKRVLLFRKIDDLVKPSDEERQSLCLVLSYYYVRIFQIYGALALTLMDDASFMTSSGLTSTFLRHPGHPDFKIGGASKELFYYAFIRSYVKDNIFDDEKGYKLNYSTTNSTVYFMPKSRMNSDGYYGAFILYFNDKKYFIECTVVEIRNYEYDFKITSLYYNKDDKRISVDVSSLTKIVVKRVNDTYTMNNTTVESGFKTLFDNILRIIVNHREKQNSDKPKDADAAGTIKELRIDEIIQNLTRVKPLGHCIARAMQLLRSQPLDNKYGISNICKTKFFETSKGASRSGIPEPGRPLSDSPGLSSLANLFYDTIYIGTPQLFIGNDKKIEGSNETSFQQYVKFMKLMSIRFGDTIKQTTPKLENIHNIRDKEVCKSMSENIYIPANTSKEVFKLVKDLFDIQLKHAERCGQIISMMFNISSDSTGRFNISLSNNIIQNGFSEIDRINHYARDILIAYYSNCEYKYVEGMKLIIESKIPPPNTIQPDTLRSKNIIRTLQEDANKYNRPRVPGQVYAPQTYVPQTHVPRYNLLNPSLFQLPPTASVPTAPTVPTAPAAPTAPAPTPTAPAPTAPTAPVPTAPAPTAPKPTAPKPTAPTAAPTAAPAVPRAPRAPRAPRV